MDFYRGDDRNFFRSEISEIGFAPRFSEAEQGYALYTALAKRYPGALNLRITLQTSPQRGTVATSLSRTGAYEGKNELYKITIPDNELIVRRLSARLEVGQQVEPSVLVNDNNYYLVHTGPNLNQSDLVGFVHKDGVREVTFFNLIPERYVAGFRYSSKKVPDGVFLTVANKARRDWVKANKSSPPPVPR